jgi:glucans biosynthesis protein
MRIRTLLLLVFAATFGSYADAAPFSFDALRQRAQALAAVPFQPDSNRVPKEFLDLPYVDYQAIGFRPDQALWRKEALPFQIEFFHPGSAHKDVVTVYQLEAGQADRIPFSPDAFSYGPNQLRWNSGGGYAGLRIVHPVGGFGEVASFLGASYLRMIGLGQTYGASARGLALNTSRIGHEEFPVFREFWLRKPAPRDREIRVFALLDSPSVAGAFEFNIEPGVTTVAKVTAVFFPRREVREFGVAPLTSMFLHDENSHPPNEDFRTEVHDSDGLQVQSSHNEWLWRPLEKGKMMRVNTYEDENPKGFGLMQRDREFEHYQDLVARYERRPSVWVKPLGNWGKGAVKLVQLPSNQEYWDNVVAFWVPSDPPKSGESLVVSYELHWGTNSVAPKSLGRAKSTLLGQVPRGSDPPNLRVVVEFEWPSKDSPAKDAPIEAKVDGGDGLKIVTTAVSKNEVNGAWRLVIETSRPDRAADLRAALMHHQRPATESWHFTWQP